MAICQSTFFRDTLYVATAAAAGSNIPICRYEIKAMTSGKKNTSHRPPRSLKTDISNSRFKPAGFDF